MNAVPGAGQPSDGTASPYDASRRTFLKGVGLAAAAGFAAPFLENTSASASTGGLILGANAPGAWSPPSGTPGWTTAVKGAVGCRAYRDAPFSTGTACPTAFPGEQGSKVVASIRPDPTVLLNPEDPRRSELVTAIKALIKDGSIKASTGYFAGTPQLTVWHEAGNMYTDAAKYDRYGIVPGQHRLPSSVHWPGWPGPTQTARSMHVTMQSLCDQVAADNPGLPRVEYGCIIYGEISQMASNTDSAKNWIPGKGYPLDWYGIDVYYEYDSIKNGVPSPHANLSTYDLVRRYMDGFLAMARYRSQLKWPKINVCECNANIHHNSARPQFFEHLAQWLHGNGGRRMLTFFPAKAGPHSVTWPYVADARVSPTVRALKNIQATYG